MGIGAFQCVGFLSIVVAVVGTSTQDDRRLKSIHDNEVVFNNAGSISYDVASHSVSSGQPLEGVS